MSVGRKITLFLVFLATFFIFTNQVKAVSPSFVTIVNPIRGNEFWDQPNQKPIDAVLGQLNILNSKGINATWLLRFDALEDKDITQLLKNNPGHEKGIFIEITPELTKAAGVKYNLSDKWYYAESVFLTGYSLEDRIKIIDVLFERYKEIFGKYPKSVGAWWIDSGSLDYMQKKYGIEASLIVADQYSTDSYQIWGQYWAAPFYPYIRNALIPAQNESEKIPVVIIQWAQRDPFNGYGKVVEDTTYSTQANDYINYHNLNINYFGKLVDIYLSNTNPINQLTLGLENSFNWNELKSEYEKQISLVVAKSNKEEVKITTMSVFASQYKTLFPKVSPTMSFFAEDPLNTGSKVLWFMDPYYRAGLFFDKEGIRFRDIREYSGGEELCFKKPCKKIDFASSFVSSIDDVAFGKSWIIDQGETNNLKVSFDNQKIIVTYTNLAGAKRIIEFLPRDISIDGKPLSISKIILDATSQSVEKKKSSDQVTKGQFLPQWLKLLLLIFIPASIFLFMIK